MKNKLLTIVLAGCVAVLSACSCGHSTRVVSDTVKNTYGTDTAKSAKTNQDTAKVTTTTGDASSLDNSASGGTRTIKDTSKKDSSKQDSQHKK
jgi:hypothetical protein